MRGIYRIYIALRASVTMLGLVALVGLSRPGVRPRAPVGIRQLSNTAADVILVAHADDWQVFMGDAIVDRIKSGRRPIFIYLTAGDHGRDSAYWQQREDAALASTRIALGGNEAQPVCGAVSVALHQIRRCLLGSSVSFFLRLPDGDRNGGGFAQNRFQSMRKLRMSRIADIDAVDKTTSYRDWQDLIATVNALVRIVADSSNSTEIVLHTTDPSVRVNPHDHYDHRIAGKLSESLLRASNWTGRYYVGYALATRAPNRTTGQRQEKMEVFSAYDREMIKVKSAWSAYHEHPSFYAECMQRTYARVVSSRGAVLHK